MNKNRKTYLGVFDAALNGSDLAKTYQSIPIPPGKPELDPLPSATIAKEVNRGLEGGLAVVQRQSLETALKRGMLHRNYFDLVD